jgi:hypothetical protein
MLKDALLEIFERDLNKLKDEINLYEDESRLWVVREEISNSAGNLCLHLIGNLNHFIGAILGDTGYARDRDREFSLKDVRREALIINIENTKNAVTNTLNGLSNDDFERDFPVEMFGGIVKIDFMLVHLAAHFNYHLGQINYHRRLIQNV